MYSTSIFLFYILLISGVLQCFDAVGWAAGRASGLYKTERWGAGVVICLQRGADLHMAQLMPLQLTVCCFSKFQIGFTFLVPAHPGSPGKRAVKRVCVLFRGCIHTQCTPLPTGLHLAVSLLCMAARCSVLPLPLGASSLTVVVSLKP